MSSGWLRKQTTAHRDVNYRHGSIRRDTGVLKAGSGSCGSYPQFTGEGIGMTAGKLPGWQRRLQRTGGRCAKRSDNIKRQDAASEKWSAQGADRAIVLCKWTQCRDGRLYVRPQKM